MATLDISAWLQDYRRREAAELNETFLVNGWGVSRSGRLVVECPVCGRRIGKVFDGVDAQPARITLACDCGESITIALTWYVESAVIDARFEKGAS